MKLWNTRISSGYIVLSVDGEGVEHYTLSFCMHIGMEWLWSQSVNLVVVAYQNHYKIQHGGMYTYF